MRNVWKGVSVGGRICLEEGDDGAENMRVGKGR